MEAVLTQTPGENLDTTPHAERWIKQGEILKRISRQTHVAHSIWDVEGRQFVFFSDRHYIMGNHAPGHFTGVEGIRYFISMIHPLFAKAIYRVYQECLDYIRKNPGSVKNSSFHFDTFYIKSETENVQLLLQAQVMESDPSGDPLVFLISITDITYLKKNHTANLVIVSEDNSYLWNYCFYKKKLEPVRGFSIQEKKLLYFLAQKKSSKEIAALLNTSSHTIDTQRRHLLQKTNCIDCTALITYSRMTGILA
jgi:DNA-binding CsgD family transcriptional regulator